MKVKLPASLAATLLLPGLSSGAPPQRGNVVFTGINCADVVATNLEVDVKDSGFKGKIEWRLLKPDCVAPSPTPNVIVGIFRADGVFYANLLDCKAKPLKNNAMISCTPTCKLPKDDQTFDYSVCVGGKALFDPELRIKGGNRDPSRLPACSTSDKATELAKCVTATSITTPPPPPHP
jgi:hypothetical protein